MNFFYNIFFFVLILLSFSGIVYAQDYSQKIIEISQNAYNVGCEINDSCYAPTTLYISKDDSVKWINYDSALHNIVSGMPGIESPQSFSSTLLATGESYEYKFLLDNTVNPYFCSIHPWMQGYVIVGSMEFEKPVIERIPNKPTIFGDYKIQKFITGLSVPTSIEFLPDDTLLILQKNDGKVLSFSNGTLNTILDLEVSNYGEQGLLGITSVDSNVYLFFTESFHDEGLALGNKIYKFEWNGESLTNKKLLKELPADETSYNGGAMISYQNGTVFAVMGEDYKAGILQNYLPENSFRHYSEGVRIDDSSKLGIIDSLKDIISCINISFKETTMNPPGWDDFQQTKGSKWESNPEFIVTNIAQCFKRFSYNEFSFGHWKDTSVILQIEPPGDYAAIGIRNSFGLAIDPVSGYLWDTENGADKFDEINLIDKKFNSGWAKTQGPSNSLILPPVGYEEYVYEDPKFSWELPIGITAIDFVDSPMFKEYENWLFVSDSNNGNIYKFRLNEDRTDFIFQNQNLQDKVLNIQDIDSNDNGSMEEILFAKNFGLVSDIEFGPDGGLYVVSLLDGIIYRIYS